MKKNMSYMDSVHHYGRIWGLILGALIIAVPLVLCLVFSAVPKWDALVKGLIATLPMYWAVGFIEIFTYVPMLGAGGTYLSFVTGNISNLKLPCAVDAMERAGVKANSEEGEVLSSARFDQVEELEKMTAEERFAFWQGELSRCIRCNACRDACPACTCEKCVFDNVDSGVANTAAADSFEENMFHIIRAFHVAGRCTDCGECSRVCPQGIPLHLLNRKFIKDMNELYGEYQAGEDLDSRAPLTNFTYDDCEPSVVHERGVE